MINREQFMDFFRSEDFQEHVSADDCREIFMGVLKGSSDLDDELIYDLYENYGIDDFIMIKWCVDDILDRFYELEGSGYTDGKPLLASEAKEILERLHHKHDCNYGITWDVIDSEIEYFIERR